MREILFRGKIFNGEWVEGTLTKWSKAHLEIREYGADKIGFCDFSVDFKTVGQFTGLTDKNDRKIFEGDIIAAKHPDHARSVSGIVKYGEFEDVDSCDTYHYLGFYIEIWGHCISILEPMNEGIELEVIGNIHDNPELLEVTE